MKKQVITKGELTPGEFRAYKIGLFTGFMSGIGFYLLLELFL